MNCDTKDRCTKPVVYNRIRSVLQFTEDINRCSVLRAEGLELSYKSRIREKKNQFEFSAILPQRKTTLVETKRPKPIRCVTHESGGKKERST